MRGVWVIGMLMLGLASPLHALSCMRPDAPNIYTWAAKSDERYHAVLGKLDFVSPPRSKQPKPQEFAAHFSGHALDRTGFNTSFSRPITVRTTCAGPWCGSIGPGENYLAMLRIDGNDLILDVNACPTTTLFQPDQTQIQTFLNCVNGKPCAPVRR